MNTKNNILKISNVSKTFDNHLVLDNISLLVQKNDIIGLAGSSGSGKSTLLRCIQNFETVDTGLIELSGTTGFIFQDFQLFPHMTVLQNLTYAPNLKNKSNIELPLNILTKLGIANKANEYPSKLSGGQKQRVALARSLMMHPEILLCDEPTSGLDVATTSDVVTLLKSIRDMGVTMIIASHDLDFLIQIANRIILLKNGKIAIDINPQTTQDPINYLKNFY